MGNVVMPKPASNIEEEIQALLLKYDQLQERHSGQHLAKICGTLECSASYDNKSVVCKYEIEIRIPKSYPDCLPQVFETAGKITKDFHQFEDGSLCIGAPTEVQAIFNRSRSLLGFVENLIIPYLFSHTCFIENGKMPCGELAHGDEGLYQYHCEHFKTDNPLAVVSFLASLLNPGFIKDKNEPCPCGSGKSFSECHEIDVNNYRSKFSLKEINRLVPQELSSLMDEAKNAIQKTKVNFEIKLLKAVFFGNNIRRIIKALSSRQGGIFYFDDGRQPVFCDSDDEIAVFRKKHINTTLTLPFEDDLHQLIQCVKQYPLRTNKPNKNACSASPRNK